MKQPQEYKVVSLRECPTPEAMQLCDTPERAADYWRLHVETSPYFNPECECLVVLLLNTRRRVKGHQLLSIGTLDTILVSPLMVYRTAVICSASAVVTVKLDSESSWFEPQLRKQLAAALDTVTETDLAQPPKSQ